MLQDKYILSAEFSRFLDNFGGQTKEVQKVYKNLETNWNIPVRVASAIISGRKNLYDYDDNVCYWILKETRPEWINRYFSKRDIVQYEHSKYMDFNADEIEMKYPGLQLASDQWLCTMTIQELMKLRTQSRLHYNPKTQRALMVKIKKGEISYAPFINTRAVKKMYDLISSNMFIPNVITLNIGEESITDENDVKITLNNGMLEIENLDAFDIIDGYNRFKAFERYYDQHPDWQFTTGVMITRFDVSKAKRLIFQEDQKTKMKRIDSVTYNQNNDLNVLLDIINDKNFTYFHQINNMGGFIRYSHALQGLKSSNINDQLSIAERKTYVSSICDKLDALSDLNTELVQRQWTAAEVITVFGLVPDQSPEVINNVLHTMSEDDKNRLELLKNDLTARRKIMAVLKKYIGKAGE